MPKFRKKPVMIEAEQFDGHGLPHLLEREGFVNPVWTAGYSDDGTTLVIDTLEGKVKARRGAWIISGVNGEFYLCKPDIFEKTYEPVE